MAPVALSLAAVRRSLGGGDAPLAPPQEYQAGFQYELGRRAAVMTYVAYW